LAALLLPGAGHLLQGARWTGAALAALFASAIATALVHLGIGLSLFESPLGSLLFGALLRASLLIYAFSVLDSYLRSTSQGDPRRRNAVLLNLLFPGSGQLWIGRYAAAATGFGALALLLFIGRNPAPYLDLILVVIQSMAALSVYHQLMQEEQRGPQTPPQPGRPDEQVASAQISVLIVLVTAVIASGWTLKLRWVDYSALSIPAKATKVRRTLRGLKLEVTALALKLEVIGEGWERGSQKHGALFRARHRLGASLMLGVDPIEPFVRFDRYLQLLRVRLEEAGYTATTSMKPHQRGGHPRAEATFQRKDGGAQRSAVVTSPTCSS